MKGNLKICICNPETYLHPSMSMYTWFGGEQYWQERLTLIPEIRPGIKQKKHFVE